MKKKIKILHCPSATGGQAWMLSRAERELGYESDNVIFRGSYINYPSDTNLNLSYKNPFSAIIKIVSFFFVAIRKYNVFHFYFGHSLLPFYIDLPILKILKKKVFFTFQGCDVRRGRYSPVDFKKSLCNKCPNKKCRNGVFYNLSKILKLKIMVFFANKTFVLNPDLKIISPSSEMLPYVNVDLTEYLPVCPKNKKPIIIHAPSHRGIKGTKHVLSAIDRLKSEGLDFDFRLLENISNKEVKKNLIDCDIVIDQLLAGWYGGFSVEAMAIGKPVICFLRKEFLDIVPWSEDIPIINADIDSLDEKLKKIINDSGLREEIGRKGRLFVEKHHNPITTARKIINFYEK